MSGGSQSVSNALKVLYPKRYSSHHDNPNDSINMKQQRFSTLLLEHGEQELQDWGVVVKSTSRSSSSADSGNTSTHVTSSVSVSSVSTSAASAFSSTLEPPSLSKKSNRNSSKKRSKSRKEKEPTTHMKSVPGRLRLCSKSLVFEPNDISRGIIRLPFDKMIDTPQNDASPGNNNNGENYRTIILQSKRFTVMKKNNIIAPHETIEKRIYFSFTFQHSTTQLFMELFEKVCNASDESLQEIIKPMCDEPFDTSNFIHMHESPVTDNLRAFILGPFPLVKKAGVGVVTKKRIYFQPFHGVHSSIANKALSWSMDDIVATARRYHGLKDEAVELFFEEGASVLIAFEGYRNRENIFRLLPTSKIVGGDEVPVLCHTDRSFLATVVNAWRNGEIDNFEYLLALNSAAGRSLFDLSRYPIFPWVLADYDSEKLDLTGTRREDGQLVSKVFRDLTKPVGALNQERLDGFKARWENMQDMGGAFLYGTHYSAPGYCLYYLVRAVPEQMLCLQNGRYDAPDRLFHSIDQCFSSLLNNPADIKESIPQFYDPKEGVDFLLNTRGLQLGVTQTGTIINDVKLPAWAKSPKDFLKKNRKALESDYCTRFLPSWLDLIFGTKSRGDQAFEADNLFHPTAYLSPSDYDEMKTDGEKFQAELQATEFGICPDVLFSAPHPQKSSNQVLNDTFIVPDLGRAAIPTDFETAQNTKMQRVSSPLTVQSSSQDRNQTHPLSPMTSIMKYAQQIKASASRDDIKEERDDTVPENGSNNDVIELNASDYSVENIESSESKINNLLLSGTGESTRGNDVNGSMLFGSEEKESQAPTNMPVEETKSVPRNDTSTQDNDGWKFKPVTMKQMHGGAVTGCHLSLGDNCYVTTISLDGGLMVHLLPSAQTKESRRRSFSSSSSRYSNPKPATSSPQQFHTFRSHQSSDPLACLALVDDNNGGTVAFAGGHDDVIMAYGIKSACGLASVYSHRDAVTGLVLIDNSSSSGTATHILVSSSWDSSVKLWHVTIDEGEKVKISKDPFAELYDAESSVNCVDAMSLPDVGLVIAAGGTDGSLIVWLWTNDGEKSVLFKEDVRSGNDPCSAVKWSSKGDIILFVGFGNGRVSTYAFQHDGMYPVSKLNVGSPVQCLAVIESSHNFFAGCADGCVRFVTVNDGGHFDHQEFKSWEAVNGTSSPGITSLSVVSTNSKRTRYSIISGAEDGSVALYLIEQIS